MPVVLADAHGGFNMGNDLAATSIRIYLRPGEWTETAFANVAADFNEHRGQLYHLEKDGFVDIYTDKAEVDALKHGKTPADALVEVQEIKNTNPTPQKKYFNMQMFTGEPKTSPEVTTATPAPVPSASTDLMESLKKQQELMQKQMEAMTQMTQAMATMMNKFSEKLDKE